MNKKKNDDFSQKLKEKLKELFQIEFSIGDDFQFDSAEFDFGIYRIMNYKRKEIENFIENDLMKAVEEEFKRYKVQSQSELLEKIKGMEKKIKEDFGEDILANGKLKEKYGEIKLVSEYLELKKQIEDVDITENIQSQTFNDLYNFFSRYYEDGDFISKRRYSSKQNKYAIPYDGEEVKLYWANFDQYYIKTGEIFKDYVFTQNGWRFIFKTTLAEVETGNVKGERRYFFLSPDKPVDIKGNICLIPFEYKPFTEKDLIEYPIKTKDGKSKKTGISQDDLNTLLKDRILDSIGLPEPKKILLEIQNGKTILEKHLYKFTRKITSDFFIHKNLKEFLERELDYFIKIEVLDIDSLDTEKERYFDRHITRAKVVKNIGKKIIEFLGQIENFQKMLWEKKKFILKTDYVITINRIPEEFHAEIINNKEQLKEWRELGLVEINKKEDLMDEKDLFNTKFQKLPVDTKYFNQDFKERLLEKLSEKDNLDDLIDGVLIKSENWQALNLLLEKYREKVKCIYIDPPYNTGSDEFLYKDKYQHSSWLSMMENRMTLSKEFLETKGVFSISIDENEESNLSSLCKKNFGENNYEYLIWKKKSNPSNTEKIVGKLTEYILLLFKIKEENVLNYRKLDRKFKHVDKDGPYNLEGIEKTNQGVYYRPTMIFPIVDYKTGETFLPKSGMRWTIGKEKVGEYIANKKLYFDYEKKKVKFIKRAEDYERSKIVFNNLFEKSGSLSMAKDEIKKLFGIRELIDTLKPTILICNLLEMISTKNSFVLDFFSGSGTTAHAVMKLNKEDGGKRKYILIEMADYFNTIIIPRLKKVCYSFNWKDGKPQDNDGISQMIKYHYLEQYEDSLHNIDFPQKEKGQKILDLLPEEEKSEYLMKYMLKFETDGSPSLLNLKQFTNPFEYKLKIISGNNKEEIVNIDLVETFNYLIGLKINKYRYLTDDNGRRYVFVLGERNYKKVTIVWRSTVDINLGKDKENIDKIINDFKPEEIYINGDSLVKNYKPIESEFKSRAGV